jgi:hypothetical protein
MLGTVLDQDIEICTSIGASFKKTLQGLEIDISMAGELLEIFQEIR